MSSREAIRYGDKLSLYHEEKHGFVVGTSSSMIPLVVQADDPSTPLRFEQTVLTVVSADVDSIDPSKMRHVGDEVKFGHVVRLVHAAQNKVLCFNAKTHAVVDKANQRISLESSFSKMSNPVKIDKWRIMPRYRVRGEGERVVNGDHIVLQISSGEQSFLHVARQEGDSGEGYEINAAGNADGFVLNLYDGDLSGTGRELHGGDCVRLFHREDRSFFAVNEAVSGTFEPIAEQRVSEMQRAGGNDDMAALNSDGLFILEFADPHRGGVVTVGKGQLFRLRSLKSGSYLSILEEKDAVFEAEPRAIEQDGVLLEHSIDLTTDITNPRTLFTFHQAADDTTTTLKNRSRVFIECPAVDEGVWLVAGESLRFSRSQTAVKAMARYPKKARTRLSVSHRDGIEIQKLKNKDYQELSIILALLPPIQAFPIETVAGFPDGSKVAHLQENLIQLRLLVTTSTTVDGTPRNTTVDAGTQRRLLSQGVASAIVNIVRSIVESPVIDLKLLHTAETVNVPMNRSLENVTTIKYIDILDIVQLCFGLLADIVRDAPKNAEALLPDLEFIVSCIDIDQCVLNCLICCYQGNQFLVDAEDNVILFHFCDLLRRRGRVPQLLEFLRYFVECGGSGMPTQQQIVTDQLLSDNNTGSRVFLTFSLVGDVHIGVPSVYMSHSSKKEEGLFGYVGDQGDTHMTDYSLSKLVEMASHTPRQRTGRMNEFINVATQQLRLFAALCRGKNSHAIALVNRYVPLETLLPAMKSEETPAPLRAAFIRLFTTSFVDTEGAVDLNDRVQSLRHVIEDPDPAYQLEEEPSSMLLIAKDFVRQFLSSCKGVMTAKKEHQQAIIDAVIELAAALLNRGSYALEEYVPLVVMLTNVLDSRNDEAVGRRYEACAEMKLVIESKLQVISLLSNLADYIITRHVYGVVLCFVCRKKLGAIAQLVELDPNLDLSHYAEARNNMNRAKRRNVLSNAFSKVEEVKSSKLMSDLFLVLFDVAQSEDARLSAAAISLFCRLVNMPGELELALKRVQLITSAGSAEFYDCAKMHSSVLQGCARNMLVGDRLADAYRSIDALDTQLASPSGGTVMEKIAMVRHLNIPTHLSNILDNIDEPPRKEYRDLIFRIVAFLRILAQDDLVTNQLCNNVKQFLHLTSHDVDILSLLRSLYVGRNTVITIPFEAIHAIANCIEHPHSAVPAVLLLGDLLTKKDLGGRYITRNQVMVWRTLVGCEGIKFARNWTGRKGGANRDRILSSAEYFNSGGTLRLHLEITRLIFLITKTNDELKPEEVRYEVFGNNAVDDLMEVVTNDKLPTFFRTQYIHLLQTLVVQDNGVQSSFLHHRLLVKFLTVCRNDMDMWIQCFSKTTDAFERTKYVWRQPANEMEMLTEEAREGPGKQTLHILMGVLPCVRHMCGQLGATASEGEGSSRMTMHFFSSVADILNEIVDAACDAVRYFFVLNDWTQFEELSIRLHRKKLRDFLVDADKAGFSGSDRWSSDIGLAVDAVVVDEEEKGELTGRHIMDERDKSLTNKWLDYIEKNITGCDSLKLENVYVTGAGVILRGGKTGDSFAKMLVKQLKYLDNEKAIRVLNLLRQVASLKKKNPYDDSIFLVPVEECDVTDDVLDLSKTLEERQNIMSEWDDGEDGEESSSTLPAVVQLFTSSNSSVINAVLNCAICLLEGGNHKMQATFMSWVRIRSDEELFVLLRTRFGNFRDSVRLYRHTVAQGHDGMHLLTDLSAMILQLRFVQLLCEGHNADVQNYFRSQPDNQISVNVLEIIVSLLEVGGYTINKIILPLLLQILASITESIQGPCAQNQDMFVSVNIGEFTTQLFRDNSKEIGVVDQRELELQAVTLLIALLEGRADPHYVAALMATVELEVLGEAMDRSLEAYNEATGVQDNILMEGVNFGKEFMEALFIGTESRSEVNDELSVGISIFIFFKTALDLQSGSNIQEFSGRRGATVKQTLRTHEAYKEINKKVSMIEIVRNGNLERVYFRVPSVSANNLRDDTKEELIKNVSRDSDNARLTDFFDRTQKLILEIEYYDNMRKTPGLSLIHRYSLFLDNFSLFCAILINVFLLVTIRAPNTIYEAEQENWQETSLTVVGLLMIVVQSLLFIHFFFGPTRVYLIEQWQEWQDGENEEAVQQSRANLSIEPPQVDLHMIEELSWPVYIIGSIPMLLVYTELWQRILYLVCSYLAFFISPVLYSIMMLQITLKNQNLYNVVRAVTKNGVSLLLTLALLLIVIYIFAIIAFYNFAEYVSPYDGLGNGFNCYSLLQCWLVLMDTGLRFGGGIGENIAPANFHDGGKGYGRLAFDFLFFVVLIVIGLNIVFGIIVDTFAELREGREFIEEDQAGKCFICGIEQNQFDRESTGGFRHHVKFEHNMWQYLYFLHYLQMKPEDDFNGQESYVHQMVLQKEPAFFPVGKAKMLSQTNKGDEEGADDISNVKHQLAELLDEKLSAVQGTLTDISERLEELEHSRTRSETLGHSWRGVGDPLDHRSSQRVSTPR